MAREMSGGAQWQILGAQPRTCSPVPQVTSECSGVHTICHPAAPATQNCGEALEVSQAPKFRVQSKHVSAGLRPILWVSVTATPPPGTLKSWPPTQFPQSTHPLLTGRISLRPCRIGPIALIWSSPGRWPTGEARQSINLREIWTIFLALKTFAPQVREKASWSAQTTCPSECTSLHREKQDRHHYRWRHAGCSCGQTPPIGKSRTHSMVDNIHGGLAKLKGTIVVKASTPATSIPDTQEEIWTTNPEPVCLPSTPEVFHQRMQLNSGGNRCTNYAFPLIRLSPRVINKIRKEQAEILLVVPHWACHLWFLDGKELSVEPPLPLPARQNLKDSMLKSSWAW